MITPMTKEELLQKIGSIERMESGTLGVLRPKSSTGQVYYNLSRNDGGKTKTAYLPRNQVDEVTQDITNYKQFKEYVSQYADLIVEQTRQERQGEKKKSRPSRLSTHKRKKSKA